MVCVILHLYVFVYNIISSNLLLLKIWIVKNVMKNGQFKQPFCVTDYMNIIFSIITRVRCGMLDETLASQLSGPVCYSQHNWESW